MSFKPRYILAQEAEERIVALFRKERGDAAEIFNTAIDACQSIVLDMYDNSSKDVVPVVRCRDCKHYEFADNRAFGMPVKICEWTGFEDVDDNDFCSRGERSEE